MHADLKSISTLPPFSLDPSDMGWVEDRFDQLSDLDKMRQLFNLIAGGPSDAAYDPVVANKAGGVTRFFTEGFEAEKSALDTAQAQSDIPLLVSADLEGSMMSLPFGTEVPNPLALAAIDDLDATREISEIMAAEALAVGINWSFTPVIDINAAWRSSIVATRGFGNDPKRIRRHALTQIDVFQKAGIAATVKHWPGEGYDDRDQHLVTTINPLDMDEWRETFGRLYQSAIDDGVKAVMSAHIALPAYAAAAGIDGVERYRPASISALLNQTLLRREMGFNGVIVSDATSMAGLKSWSDRRTHVPELIENGCDMILFTDDYDTDLAALQAAFADGRLSQARLDAAVARLLGLKASLGLHKRAPSAATVTPQSDRVAPITARAPTLVKDLQNTLPIAPETHKKLYIFDGKIASPLTGDREFALIDMLRGEGFDITVHDPNAGAAKPWADHDLVLYLLGEETLLTRGRIFLDWLSLTGHFGQAMERPWFDVPTALISFGYPYYLYDAPRMPCVINAYMAGESMQRAVLEALLGRAPFAGISPIDPFCGLPDARF